jgi:hypothetical protein
MKGAKLGLAVWLAATLALPVLAHAQDTTAAPTTDEERSAQARALFSEGVSLAGEQHYSEAAERFRAALALRDAPAIRYNLASTLYEEHQLAEAHEIARALLAMPDLPDSVRTPTVALEQQIRAQAGFVTFTLPDGVTGDVQVDDVPVADPSVDTAVAIGRHEVRASRDGTTVASATFEIGSGVTRVVHLDPVSASSGGGGSGELVDQWWFWAAVGGGAVVLGVIIGVAAGVADHDAHQPIAGNFTPGIISW